MGIIECDIHGRSSLIETCKHVAVAINNKKYGKFYYAGLLLVCEDCLHKYNLESFVDKYTPPGMTHFDLYTAPVVFFRQLCEDEEFDKKYYQFIDSGEREMLCRECIAAVKSKHEKNRRS